MSFETHLDLRYLNGTNYLLLSDFKFFVYHNINTGEYRETLVGLTEMDASEFHQLWFVVPKGFVTDFASVPEILQGLIPPTGRYGKAAVIHDYLYRTAGQNIRLFNSEEIQTYTQYVDDSPEFKYKIDFRPISQQEADKIFRIAMNILGVKPWREFLLYNGVKYFGALTYDLYLERNCKRAISTIGDEFKLLNHEISCYGILPLRMTLAEVKRNLFRFEGIEGWYLNYNFSKI